MVEALIPTGADARLLRHFANLSLGFWIGPTRRKATLFALGLFACLLLNLAPAIAVNRWSKLFFERDERLLMGMILITSIWQRLHPAESLPANLQE
jgi:putative ATP-binding cassette transporter